MSTQQDEKHVGSTVEKLAEANVVEVKVVKGTEAYNEALLKEKPNWSAAITWRLVGCLLLGCFCQTMNGFDGMLFGGLTANQTFLDFFNGDTVGEWQAINSTFYQVGGIIALPFVGPCIDFAGRKSGMIIGALIVILGTIINGTSVYNPGVIAQLQASRFILGFGVSICSSAGPIYVVETAHPAWRGVITAYCNTFWFTGSILSSGAVRGALLLKGNISWTIPVWLQMVFPGLIVLFVWFIPESPRWCYVHNKRERAVSILTKWHGYGNEDSPWVKLQLNEYEEYLNMNGADKRWWDYRALFRDRASRYRVACMVLFSAFGQWAGNGALSYFQVAVLETVGVTNGVTQANMGLGYSCFQFAFALIGAAFVERIGRRPMMIGAMAGCTLVWACFTGTTATFAKSGETDQASAKATLALIYLFGAFFSFGITPLQALYPVEVLSYEQRAKGMALSSLTVNAAGLLNGYAWPIALEKIKWRTYIIFMIWCAIQTAVFYILMPETKRRTLEELDKIFEARRPVKASLEKHKLAVDNEGTVLASEEV